MVQDSQISGDDLVLQDGSSWDVNPVPVVGDDDDGPPETHSFPEGDVPGHCEVVQLQHVRDGTKSDQKVLHFLEFLPAKLYEWSGGEHPLKKLYLDLIFLLKTNGKMHIPPRKFLNPPSLGVDV